MPAPNPELDFSPDYAAARRLFLSAAERRGASIASRPIAARGPRGEELAIDTAYLGPAAAKRLLLVTSGIHGVEGYAGSAIQHRLLREQLDALPLAPDTGILLVHALNPYGFAHTRRVNESNVDLNRNFLRHPDEHVANPDYDRLYEAINPTRFDDESEAANRLAMLEFAQVQGFPRLQHVLTCGQFVHPRGFQFGGTQEEESNRHLRQILREHRHEARVVSWLDLHTGLGPYGEYELVSQHRLDDPAYLLGRRWFGAKVRSTLSGESASALLFGDMLDGAVAEFDAPTTVVALAPEFGTYDTGRVFTAMRADNWLTHHGDVESERGRSIKAELLEVFRPSDRTWQSRVLAGGAEVIGEAVAGLAAF